MHRDALWAFGHRASTEDAERCFAVPSKPLPHPDFQSGASPIMIPTPSPRPAVPKVRRVRIYTRFSHALRKHLLAYCAATGRSERAVIEDAVARYLANPAKDPSTSGPLDRLAQAIDDDRRLRERQHRELEILSETFGRFLRLWTMVHAPTFAHAATTEAAEALSRQRAAGESLFRRFAGNVAEHFRRGHRFVHDLPGLEGSPAERDGKP